MPCPVTAARLVYEGAALASFPGAQRLLQLDVQRGWWRPQALPLARALVRAA